MRWLLRIAFALVCGLLLNFLIAWSCAARSKLTYDQKVISTRTPPPQLPTSIPAEWLVGSAKGPPPTFDWIMASGLGIDYSQCEVDVPQPSLPRPVAIRGGSFRSPVLETDRFELFSWRCGWPMRSLECTASNVQAAGIAAIGETEDAWSVRALDHFKRPGASQLWWYDPQGLYLPLKPLPMGLVVNTVLLATTILVLRFGPMGIRSAYRRRGGQCPACAYDLRNLPLNSPCPECGKGSAPTPASPTLT